MGPERAQGPVAAAKAKANAKAEALKKTKAAADKEGYVKVCDADAGFCTLVFKDDAASLAGDGSCALSSVELLDEKTGEIVSQNALVCDLSPESKTICDPISGVCKVVATSDLDEILNGKPCPLCGALPQHQRKKWTQEDLKRILEELIEPTLPQPPIVVGGAKAKPPVSKPAELKYSSIFK